MKKMLKPKTCWCSGTCPRRDSCEFNEDTCPDAKVLKRPGVISSMDDSRDFSDDFIIGLLRERRYTGELRKSSIVKI